MAKLSGKTAVVTGGGTGIGLGIARALAAEGCRVAIAGRREDKLQAAQATCVERLLARTVDVGDLSSVEELFCWAAHELGPLDILVNSAGVNVVKRTMAELSPEDWDYMLRINATGTFYCMRTVLPAMRARRDGLIVNVSSIAGIRSSLLGGVGYTASKYAVSALGLTAGREERDYGIRITNVYPGEVDTPILEHRPQPVSAAHRARILKPEDVAAAVLMVACLPAHAHVPELVIKPTSQDFA